MAGPLNARITYTIPTSPPTTKTIILPKPKLYVSDPYIPKEIQTTLTGQTDTILFPRLDIKVHAEFPPSKDLDLRMQVHNWWQWAQQGNAWRFVFDSTKTVKTTLSGAEAVGQTVLSVTSTTGFTVGEQYVIRSSYLYALVKVSSVDTIGGTITVSEAINLSFPSGAVVRDQYLWDAELRNPGLPCPIRDLGPMDGATWGTWDWAMDFYEDVA